MKAAEATVAVILIALLVVFIAGFIPFSYPLLTRKVTAIAKKSGADTCAIGTVRAAVWKGVSLHNVVIAGSFAPGRRYRAQARSLSLNGNCAWVALRRAAIRRAMEQEKASLEETLKKAPMTAPLRLFRSAVAVAGIKGIGLEKMNLLLADKSGEMFSGQEMTAHVSADGSDATGMKGTFSAARLGTRGIDLLSETNAEFSSEGDLFTLSRCRAQFFEGKMRCDARVDCSRRALTAGTLSVSGCDIDKWYAYGDTSNGRCRGKGDLKVALDSSALAVDSLRGKGSLSISRFEVSNFPFQKTLVSLLLYPPVMHLKFKKFHCNFTLRQGGIFATNITGEGDSLSIAATGTVSLHGKINERLVCTISKDAVNTLPELAQKTLEDAPGGGRILRFRIYGQLANPKVEIESKVILQKAVKNVFEDVKQNLQMWLNNK